MTHGTFVIADVVICRYTVVLSLPLLVCAHVYSVHACAYKRKWFIRLTSRNTSDDICPRELIL